jgi:hypothetical protein
VLLPITADVLAEEAQRLAAGGHRYSSRQLYYAACRAVERPPASIARGLIGLGAVLIALAGCMLWVTSFPLSLVLAAAGVALLVAVPVNARLERAGARRRAGTSRALAASYEGFTAGPLSEALRSRPEAFVALVGGVPQPGRAADSPTDIRIGAGSPPGPVIVCDRPETAELLRANAGRLPEGASVVDLARLLGSDGELAPDVRDRRLVALHDAGPAGCGMPSALRAAGGADVVDAGLRPPASDAGLQVIEGAPARLAAGIEADLTTSEVQWLRSGRRLELATLSPPELIGLAIAGCQASATSRPSRG